MFVNVSHAARLLMFSHSFDKSSVRVPYLCTRAFKFEYVAFGVSSQGILALELVENRFDTGINLYAILTLTCADLEMAYKKD